MLDQDSARGIVASLGAANDQGPLDALERDADRFRFLIADPETGRHLLSLLNQGKGNADSLRQMIDRIQASKAAAQGRAS